MIRILAYYIMGITNNECLALMNTYDKFLITMPVDDYLLTSLVVTAGSDNTFTYPKQRPTDSLFQFSKFSIEIPKGFDTSSIK